MVSSAKYMVEYLGDLPLEGHVRSGHDTLDEALAAIASKFGSQSHYGDDPDRRITPDPEDDRIIVWEVDSGSAKAVWHFSGWHWQHDAGDLPGGPLPQGVLPGDTETLYGVALSE